MGDKKGTLNGEAAENTEVAPANSRSTIETFQTFSEKLRNILTSAKAIVDRPGAKSRLIDRAQSIVGTSRRLNEEMQEVWARLQMEAGRRTEKEKAAFEKSRQRISNAQSAVNSTPAESRQAAQGQFELAQAAHRAAQKALQDTEERVRAAAGADALRLREIDTELNSVVEVMAELHKEATAGASLAEAGVDAVEFSTKEFKEARDFHRRSAYVFLVGIGLVGVAGAHLVVNYIFKAAGKPPEGIEPWLYGVMVVGGRVSVLAAIGWILIYCGKLQSRHSQQAVRYQDRLVGLEAALQVVRLGNPAVREEVLRKMADVYIASDINAFNELPDRLSKKEVLQAVQRVAEKGAGSMREIADNKG